MIDLEAIKDRRDLLQAMATSWVNGEPVTEVFVPTGTLSLVIADYDALIAALEAQVS